MDRWVIVPDTISWPCLQLSHIGSKFPEAQMAGDESMPIRYDEDVKWNPLLCFEQRN